MLALIIRYWKSLLILIVLLASWLSFFHSEIPRLHGLARIMESLYYAINLFIIGALDIGFPHGSSRLAIIILWICYFLALLCTLSLVYEVLQERIFSRLMPMLKGHTIICGLGRNGKLIYHLIRRYSPRQHKIVLIDSDFQNPYLEALGHDRGTWLIKNDFTKLPVLLKARVQTAKRVFITTNRDLSNLKALVEIIDIEPKSPDFKLYCHLGDLNLHANFGATLFKEPKFSNVILFNGYQSVTRRLYRDWVLKGDYLKPQGNIFVILGFGRFGQMLYNQIIADPGRSENDEIFIDTLKSKSGFELERFQYAWSSSQPKAPCKIHPPSYLDMNNPVLWNKLVELDENVKKQMLIFACSDNDIQNLNLAISMKLTGPQRLKIAKIFCRMYSHTAKEINEILERRITKSQARDIILFPLQEELEQAFRSELFIESDNEPVG